jgi:hypothetical protein
MRIPEYPDLFALSGSNQQSGQSYLSKGALDAQKKECHAYYIPRYQYNVVVEYDFRFRRYVNSPGLTLFNALRLRFHYREAFQIAILASGRSHNVKNNPHVYPQ